MALISILLVLNSHPFSLFGIFRKFYQISWNEWGSLLKIGLPIGLSLFFETSIFSAVTLLMSVYDTITIASIKLHEFRYTFIYDTT